MKKFKEYLTETSQAESMKLVKQAKALAKKGKFEDAWEVAKNDTTLVKATTKEKWIKWMKATISE